MKRITLLICTIMLAGCCMSQLPTQYAYVDETCSAILPDFTEMVIVGDNCSVVNVTQVPMPGIVIQATTTVRIVATDQTGNLKAVDFDVVIMDTIAPTIMLNPEWLGYTDQEVTDMYKVYYGWVQGMGDIWNATKPGTIETIVLPDTTLTYVNDSMIYFKGVIPITQYRADEGYWQNTNLDLTASFK
jgi:hypothetical protein